MVPYTGVLDSKEIEVSLDNLFTGAHNAETGELKWEFTLEPGKEMELDFKYSVKYPRDRTLVKED